MMQHDFPLTPAECFTTWAATRRYGSPLARRIAVQLAGEAWQVAPDGKSGLVDVDASALAGRLGIFEIYAIVGLASLRYGGVLTVTGPAVGTLVGYRIDLSLLPSCSSAGRGTWTVPQGLRETEGQAR